MIQKINLALLVIAIVAFTGVYTLKFSIEHTAGEKVALENLIAEQEAELSLLKADWAVLIQPGHIEPIVRRHQEVLELAEVQPEQFGTFAELPMRPAAPDRDALNDLFQALEAGVDPIGALLEEIE
jgi:hypothetical protein